MNVFVFYSSGYTAQRRGVFSGPQKAEIFLEYCFNKGLLQRSTAVLAKYSG